MKTLYTNRSGEQVATVNLTQVQAHNVIQDGPIKVGWSRCRIKEKITIPRCTNCLKVGHIAQLCRAKKSQRKKCIKWTQEGHTASDCTAEMRRCITCSQDGHRSDSMRCPRYRKLVYEKEKLC